MYELAEKRKNKWILKIKKDKRTICWHWCFPAKCLIMSDIFGEQLAIGYRGEGLHYSASRVSFTWDSQFSKSVCFALKPRFLICFWFGDLQWKCRTNFLVYFFLGYLLPVNFILFLCILIIFVELGSANVNIFPHSEINWSNS